MPGESQINIDIVTTGDTTGADKVAASTAKTTVETQKLTAATSAEASALQAVIESLRAEGQELDLSTVRHQKLARAVRQVAEEKQNLGTQTYNTGYSMLAFGKVVEDTQKSVFAMTRGLSMLAVSMGLGAGVAGVIYIASTAFQVLEENLDLTGKKADELMEKSLKLAESTADVARQAAKAADAERRHRDGLETLKGSIAEVTEKYKEQIQAIEKLTAKKIEALQFDQHKEDAQFRLEMAQLKEKYPDGGVGYEKEKAAIVETAEKNKYDREQRALLAEKQKADAVEKAANAGASEMADKVWSLKDRGAGLLSEEERKKQLTKRRDAEQERATAQEEMERAKEWGYGDAGKLFLDSLQATGEGDARHGMSSQAWANKMLAEERDRISRDAYRKMTKGDQDFKDSDALLQADKTSRGSTSLKSSDELQSKIESMRAEEKKLQDAAQKAKEERDSLIHKANENAQLFDINRRTVAAESRVNISSAEKTAQEKSNAEKIKDLEADLKQALADIDLQKAQGKITGPQADTARADARAKSTIARGPLTKSDDDARLKKAAGAEETEGAARRIEAEKKEAERHAKEIERILHSTGGDHAKLMERLLKAHEKNASDLKSKIGDWGSRISNLEAQFVDLSNGN